MNKDELKQIIQNLPDNTPKTSGVFERSERKGMD
jgi:hypothetical protein